MLIGNYSVLQKGPGRFFAGSTTSVAGQVRSNFSKSGSNRNRFYVSQTTEALKLYAVPTGTYAGLAWVLPQVAGQIASTQPIQGAGTQTGNLAGGQNTTAALSGSGDITNAGLDLVVSLIATLVGTGNITTADVRGILEALANLSGTGELSGVLQALASLSTSIEGTGTVSNATPYATGDLSATILSYGILTPEGIRDSVWNAIATNYNLTNTMGNKLNSAASGGIDYNALAAAVWDALQSTYNTPGTMGAAQSASSTPGLTLAQFLALQNP